MKVELEAASCLANAMPTSSSIQATDIPAVFAPTDFFALVMAWHVWPNRHFLPVHLPAINHKE
jgi:hypothetical protein